MLDISNEIPYRIIDNTIYLIVIIGLDLSDIRKDTNSIRFIRYNPLQ